MAGYIKNGDGTYSVNYDDQRFKDIKNEQAQRESQTTQNYDSMINNSQKYYDDQINAAKDYADKQSELQQAQTDFAIEQINQEKEKTEKDYIREQKGSYVDYQKESNKYGVNAEQMAASGLSNTGYSESSKVNIYNTYQNRVASARETYNQATMNFNNQIQQATLSNNETLAEIAYNALQTQLQLSQQAFEYKNTLVLAKEEALQQINEIYYARFQDVLNQINNEIDLQVQIDKFNREYELEIQKLQEQIRVNNAQIANLEVEAEYKRAQIANVNAQTAYTRSQAAALSSSNNPYSNSSSGGGLSSKAQGYYNDIRAMYDKTAKDVYSSAGKQRLASITANAISTLYNQGKITKNEVAIMLSKFGLS